MPRSFPFLLGCILICNGIAARPVVLLHGLARTSSSMKKMEGALNVAGFRVCNIDYPSRKHPIDTLVERFVFPGISRCFPGNMDSVNFVTHSLGGILVRRLAVLHPEFRIGRVVMLSPPNRGSEVVDKLGGDWWFRKWNGPAGNQLGTDSNSVPNRLPRPAFEFGVLAGTRSLDPISSWLIPGKDDGKVSLKNMRLEGMKDYREIAATHTYIMQDNEAIRQCIQFLKNGIFLPKTDRN
jgi:pimeloyl-ACP methyl ester carboxylesterase